MSEFEKELEQLINKHSIENESNTPDFVLARYLVSCLNTFKYTMIDRDAWHGNIPKPNLEIKS